MTEDRDCLKSQSSHGDTSGLAAPHPFPSATAGITMFPAHRHQSGGCSGMQQPAGRGFGASAQCRIGPSAALGCSGCRDTGKAAVATGWHHQPWKGTLSVAPGAPSCWLAAAQFGKGCPWLCGTGSATPGQRFW